MGLRFCGMVLLDPRPGIEGLKDFADLGLHQELDVSRDLAESSRDESQEAGHLREAIAHRVPGDFGLTEAEFLTEGGLDFETLRSQRR